LHSPERAPETWTGEVPVRGVQSGETGLRPP
jgi:hypothetical protein